MIDNFEMPELLDAPQSRFGLGGNHPPSAIDAAKSVYAEISAWLLDRVAIQTEQDALDAKLRFDRGKAAIKALDAEREAEAKPLHAAWQAVLAKSKPTASALNALLDDLKKRMTVFALAEERRRQALLDAARIAHDEAEAKAAAADAALRLASEDAHQGDCEADVGAAIEAAEAAKNAMQNTTNDAVAAWRHAKAPVMQGGFANAIGLKDKKTLVINDHVAAIAAIGLTDDIREAILKSARAFVKEHGRLPNGISETTKREL